MKSASVQGDNGRKVIVEAVVEPAVNPDVGGYFIYVRDDLGNYGLMVDPGTMNITKEEAGEKAKNLIGQKVTMW